MDEFVFDLVGPKYDLTPPRDKLVRLDFTHIIRILIQPCNTRVNINAAINLRATRATIIVELNYQQTSHEAYPLRLRSGHESHSVSVARLYTPISH